MALNNHDITTWPGRNEAARFLGVSSELVAMLMDQGKLQFIATKLGRLIDPSDLERLRLERAAGIGVRRQRAARPETKAQAV